MKFLFDLFPVIVFFAVFKLYDIYYATAVAILTTFLQFLWSWLRNKKIEKMLLVNLLIIAVFGGATLILKDELFIKWKPTVLYWFFSLALFISPLFFKKNLIKLIMGAQIKLPDQIWNNLNISWMLFFFAMGIINLYVAFNFSTDLWVNFKLFGSTALMLIFCFIQVLFISKYLKEPIKENEDKKIN